VSRGVVTPSTLERVLPTLASSNAAFFTLFGVFIVAMFVLIFLTLRFVIRRDRAGRKAWLERQSQGEDHAEGGLAGPP
jgi:hypothetical protein